MPEGQEAAAGKAPKVVKKLLGRFDFLFFLFFFGWLRRPRRFAAFWGKPFILQVFGFTQIFFLDFLPLVFFAVFLLIFSCVFGARFFSGILAKPFILQVFGFTWIFFLIFCPWCFLSFFSCCFWCVVWCRGLAEVLVKPVVLQVLWLRRNFCLRSLLVASACFWGGAVKL